MSFVVEGLEEGVVFFADEGLEARCRLEADGLAAVAAFFLVAVLSPALAALDSGSVFEEAEAATGSAEAAGWGALCFGASFQFGEESPIRWREKEVARRQRGQCAS